LPLKPIHSPALDWAAADAFVVTGEYSGRSPSAPLLPRRQPLSSSPTSFLHSPLALKELGANDGPKQELKRIDRPPQELDQDSIRLSNLLIMQIESWLEAGRDKHMGPARFRREIDIVQAWRWLIRDVLFLFSLRRLEGISTWVGEKTVTSNNLK
jgi:hypothetical protein